MLVSRLNGMELRGGQPASQNGLPKEEQYNPGDFLALHSLGQWCWWGERGNRKPLHCFLPERLFTFSSCLRNANKAMIHLSHRVSTSSKGQWVTPAICPFACYGGLCCSVFLSGMPCSPQTALSSPMRTRCSRLVAAGTEQGQGQLLLWRLSFCLPAFLPSLCSGLESVHICQDWVLLKHWQSYCDLERNASSNSGPADHVRRDALPSSWLSRSASQRCLEFPPTSSILWCYLFHHPLNNLPTHQRCVEKGGKEGKVSLNRNKLTSLGPKNDSCWIINSLVNQ